MALPDDLNMSDVQLARLCRKQDAEIEGLRTELSLTQAVNMAQATEIDKLRAALTEIAKDDPSGKWGRWARESLSHEQSQQSKENGS